MKTVGTPGGAGNNEFARDGQLISGASLPVRLANFVKLPHTVFAMPFALVGVLFASMIVPVTAVLTGWVIVAFTAARFAAMGFNRIVDRDVDASNPRTANRELPRGTLSLKQAVVSVAVASALFVIAAWQINWLCFMLSPVTLAWIFGYSYAKRFTRWSHLWLGLGLSIAPVGGYLAVTGEWSTPIWMLCALALAVVSWSGGFDVLYALQDIDFDRRHGLHSLPAALGVKGAIAASRVMHVVAVASLVAVVFARPFGASVPAGGILAAGTAAVVAILIWEHRLVKADDLSRVDAAFFTMNGVISLLYLAAVAVARFVANA